MAGLACAVKAAPPASTKFPSELGHVQGLEPALVKMLVTELAIEALDISALHWAPGGIKMWRMQCASPNLEFFMERLRRGGFSALSCIQFSRGQDRGYTADRLDHAWPRRRTSRSPVFCYFSALRFHRLKPQSVKEHHEREFSSESSHVWSPLLDRT